MMTFMEAHAAGMGEFHYQGRHYVLISLPYTFFAKDERTRYTADAICEDDKPDEGGFYPVYNVRWPVKNQHLLDYCQAQLAHDGQKAYEIKNEWDVDEESLEIEWDAPYSVNESMYKYNPEEVSKRYSWD